MMLLKMQIEKARGEAELVQIKAQLNQMREAAAAAGGCGVMTQQPSCVVFVSQQFRQYALQYPSITIERFD